MPVRSWRKNTGPREVAFTAIAQTSTHSCCRDGDHREHGQIEHAGAPVGACRASRGQRHHQGDRTDTTTGTHGSLDEWHSGHRS